MAILCSSCRRLLATPILYDSEWMLRRAFLPINAEWGNRRHILGYLAKLTDPTYSGTVYSYDSMMRTALLNLQNPPSEWSFFPGVCPSWDNHPRNPPVGSSTGLLQRSMATG